MQVTANKIIGGVSLTIIEIGTLNVKNMLLQNFYMASLLKESRFVKLMKVYVFLGNQDLLSVCPAWSDFVALCKTLDCVIF